MRAMSLKSLWQKLSTLQESTGLAGTSRENCIRCSQYLPAILLRDTPEGLSFVPCSACRMIIRIVEDLAVTFFCMNNFVRAVNLAILARQGSDACRGPICGVGPLLQQTAADWLTQQVHAWLLRGSNVLHAGKTCVT